MEYALLRSLRTLGPGLILLFYFDLFLVYVLRRGALIWDLETSKIILVAYVVGAIYAALTSRLKKDARAFVGVQEALVDSLAKVFPCVVGRQWKSIAPCFYALVDKDPSMKHKSQGIQFNGLIVTTSHDATWISLVAAILGGCSAVATSDWTFLIVAVAVVFVSQCVWEFSLRRHIELGAGQVAVIEKRFAKDFSDCVQGRCWGGSGGGGA